MLAKVTLTPEQEALIPVYREKWKSIVLSTDPIDCKKAARAIEAAYASLNKEKPVIIYCSSPFAALRYLFELQVKPDLSGNELRLNKLYNFHNSESYRVRKMIYSNTLDLNNLSRYQQIIRSKLEFMHKEMYRREYARDLIKLELNKKDNLRGYRKARKRLEPLNYVGNEISGDWQLWSGAVDFCISVLGLYDEKWEIDQWEIVRALIEECGWIFTFENHAIVCGRPVKISLDSQNRLHAEGTPAIQFADGYGIYYHHGVTLPEKYGRLHPNQWQSKWLLTEENVELKRVLIQGIGYSRICLELAAFELDRWGEYSLLQLDKRIDGTFNREPINLLKMTCHSTGHIHCLRVPPNLRSAREAIKWVNWEIDPEEFSVQT
ncbi:MAG: DUF6745 domain-containing protein [Hormoscilla sp.]